VMGIGELWSTVLGARIFNFRYLAHFFLGADEIWHH